MMQEALVSTPNEPNVSIWSMDRTSSQVGGEAGWVSIDSDTVIFINDSDLSPNVINTLMDSDGNQVRVIREFDI